MHFASQLRRHPGTLRLAPVQKRFKGQEHCKEGGKG